MAAGSYTLKARAIDNSGVSTDSSPVSITVNAPPAVSIATPANGASFTAPINISITANATDSDGSISHVDFYNGTMLIGISTSSPYNYAWNNVSAGTYSITAKATDNLGAQTSSTVINITVNAPPPAVADIRWIVTDQLGTPRMIFDESGGFAKVSRHDYLPFGEELFAGGRTTTNGYTNNDGERERFTGYERDNESGLDYAHARYFANTQGRFTSPDPLMASGHLTQPQSWNRYSYVSNNPINETDPSGLYNEGGGTEEDNPQKPQEPHGGTCSPTTPCTMASEDELRVDNALIVVTAPTSVATPEAITTSSTPAITSIQLKLAQAVQAPTPSEPIAATVNPQPASSPPDFKSLEIGTGKIGVGLSFSATRDRSGNWYFGVKPNLGFTLFPVTASFVEGSAYDSDGQRAPDPSSVRSAISGISLAGDVTFPTTDVVGRSWNSTPVSLGLVPMGSVILPGAGGTKTTGHGINIPGSVSGGVNFVFHIPFTGP